MPGGAGILVARRYLLAEVVGQGGMGRVWRGLDQVLDREVAVKEVLLPTQSPDERAILITRTMREARATARLDHPSVITIYDVVEYEDAPWIVMRFVAGPSLSAEITREGRLPWQRVALTGAQVADALGHAHAAGIIHRDLKPDNILLAVNRAIVTDFGIAQVRDATAQLTGTGMRIGTLRYMAPEQLEDGDVGPPADMWALGATLYTAVEGSPPFGGSTQTATLAAILGRPAAPPAHAGPLRDLIEALLSKDPVQRPDAQAATSALASAITPGGVTALAGLTAPGGPAISAAAPGPAPRAPAMESANSMPGQREPHQVTAAPGPPSAALALTEDVRVRPPAPAGLPAAPPRPRHKAWLVTGVTAGIAVAGVLALVLTLMSPAPHGPRSASSPPARGPALSGTLTGSLTDVLVETGSASFSDVAFSPDGKTIAADFEDLSASGIDLWNSASRKLTTLTYSGGGNGVDGLAFSPKNAGSLAVADFGGVDIWNLTAGTAKTYKDPDGSLAVDVAYTPDGRTVAEANSAGNIYLLNVSNGQWSPRSFRDPDASKGSCPVACRLVQVAVSPTGKVLAAIDAAGNVYLWTVSGGTPVAVKGATTWGGGHEVAFSPDGKTLAIAYPNAVRLWNVANQTFSVKLAGSGAAPEQVAFSGDGTTLAVSDGDNRIYLWNLATRHEAAITPPVSLGRGLAFSPDGKTIAAFDSLATNINLYRITYAHG